MKKLNEHKGINGKIYPYIINCIDAEAYEITATTERDKLQFLADCFYNEKVKYNNQKTSKLELFIDWCQGLPSCFNIEFENYKILELAVNTGGLKPDYTEKEADKILNNYFNFIACKTFQLFNKYDIVLK